MKKGILTLITFAAMIGGFILGTFFNVPWLGSVSLGIVTLFRIAAIPLLFFAILDAILKLEIRVKGVGYLIVVTVINLAFAIFIALVLSHGFHAGRHMPLNHDVPIHLLSTLPRLGHGDLGEWALKLALFKQPMLIVICFALLLGLATHAALTVMPRLSAATQGLTHVTQRSLSLCLSALSALVMLVPIAVFASVAKSTALYGTSFLGGLASYFLITVLGMVIHVGFVYQTWIWFFAKMSLLKFWHAAKEPVLYSFGINSSLATLPVTLRALETLGVSKGASRLSACLGTNFNNDGILLYEVVAVLFLAQAYGLSLSLSQDLLIALLAILAMFGVGGMPEAGIVSLTLVLGTVGMPVDAVPLLLGVDWIVARLRSSTNVLGDMTGAIVIDRFLKR